MKIYRVQYDVDGESHFFAVKKDAIRFAKDLHRADTTVEVRVYGHVLVRLPPAELAARLLNDSAWWVDIALVLHLPGQKQT